MRIRLYTNPELTTPVLNRDPQNTRTDAELLDVLKRAWLLPKDGTEVDPTTEAKFSLNSAVSDEGMHAVPAHSVLTLIDPSLRIELQRG